MSDGTYPEGPFGVPDPALRDEGAAPTLAEAPTPAALAPRVRRTVLAFDPAVDGFSFANSFRWRESDIDVLADGLRPLTLGVLGLAGFGAGRAAGGGRGGALGAAAGVGLGALGLGPALVRAVATRWRSFGLCGGMALTAAERWPNRGGTRTCELGREPLRPLLWRRQRETLRRSLPRFLASWLAARADGSAHPPLGERLTGEVQRAVAQIEAGRPVVLGLVGDAPDPFSNHQVVAFGVAHGPGPADATFLVYDPNAPAATRHVRTALLASDPSRTDVTTDLPTGPRAAGHRCHISTRQGRLATILTVV